jgi:hypothetical protein
MASECPCIVSPNAVSYFFGGGAGGGAGRNAGGGAGVTPFSTCDGGGVGLSDINVLLGLLAC